jgi:hypothetical protein
MEDPAEEPLGTLAYTPRFALAIAGAFHDLDVVRDNPVHDVAQSGPVRRSWT